MYSKKDLTKKARVKKRIRAKVTGTQERPRLSVFKSNKFLTAQLIDDSNGITLASSSAKKGIEGAKELGKAISGKSKIKTIVFDRNGYTYDGLVKQIAESAREGGLKF